MKNQQIALSKLTNPWPVCSLNSVALYKSLETQKVEIHVTIFLRVNKEGGCVPFIFDIRGHETYLGNLILNVISRTLILLGEPRE
jgi:hypothetical protein